VSMENKATWQPLHAASSEFQPGANGSIHNRCRSDDISADNDHHHLHGEGNQGPEVLPPESRVSRALMSSSPTIKLHDSDQRKNQRIRKPALAPVGKSQTKANQRLFLSGRSFS